MTKIIYGFVVGFLLGGVSVSAYFLHNRCINVKKETNGELTAKYNGGHYKIGYTMSADSILTGLSWWQIKDGQEHSGGIVVDVENGMPIGWFKKHNVMSGFHCDFD